MTTTRETLLFRLRDHADDSAWSEFYSVYAPLMYRYARARGLSERDAEEIRDQCLEVVVRRMPDFEYDRSRGRFKAWLHRIVTGRVVDAHRRRREATAESADLAGLLDPQPAPDELWEEEWRRGILRASMDRARQLVSPRDFDVFESLLEGRPVAEVCERFAINPNQVYKAKGRVLKRVRDVMLRIDV